MSAIISRRPLTGDVVANNLNPVLERVYRARGVCDANELRCDTSRLCHYNALKGIDESANLIADALIAAKHIVIIGDFDADGATSTALCMLALRAMGAKQLSYLVPNRFDFGYGLSPQIVDVAKAQQAELIITVDSGIACIDGVAHARAQHIDVVITDHHLPGDSMPAANGIVNPNQPGCEFPSKNLAGVGVAFYVMSAVRAALQQQGWFEHRNLPVPNLATWLDIVAVGTVADVVKLDHNNRVLVHQGLMRIKAGKCRPGIKAILEIAKRPLQYLSATDLGFVVGPRLNAAGRLDDMSLGIECLLADDVYMARRQAAELDHLNQERKQIETSMRIEAEQTVEKLLASSTDQHRYGIVAYQPDFHQGVIGIVAGRLREKFNRPSVTFAEQDDAFLKGSARSVPGVHIRDVLESIDRQSPGTITKFGGHAMAAGLTLPKAELDNFSELFNRQLTEFDDLLTSDPVIHTDGELEEQYLNLAFATELNQAGPFGQGFEAPLFEGQFIVRSQRLVGEKHLKLILQTPAGLELDGIAFNVDLNLWPDPAVTRVTVVYALDINVFRNNTSVQLLVEHLHVST